MSLYYTHYNVYKYSPIQMQDAQQTGTEWDVTKMESETIITHTPWTLDADTDISISRTLIIRITVQRQSQPQNIILVTPLMGMCHITSAPFQLLGLLNVLVVLRQ
jgi:hypothetical protein